MTDKKKMTHDELKALATAAKARALEGNNLIAALCRPDNDPARRRWRMSIPAQQDDPDLMLSAVAMDSAKLADTALGLLDENARLRARVAELERERDKTDRAHDSEIRHWAEVTGCPPGVTLADHLSALKTRVAELDERYRKRESAYAATVDASISAQEGRAQAEDAAAELRARVAELDAQLAGAEERVAKANDYALDRAAERDQATKRAEQAEANAQTLARIIHRTWATTDPCKTLDEQDARRRALAYPEVKP